MNVGFSGNKFTIAPGVLDRAIKLARVNRGEKLFAKTLGEHCEGYDNGYISKRRITAEEARKVYDHIISNPQVNSNNHGNRNVFKGFTGDEVILEV